MQILCALCVGLVFFVFQNFPIIIVLGHKGHKEAQSTQRMFSFKNRYGVPKLFYNYNAKVTKSTKHTQKTQRMGSFKNNYEIDQTLCNRLHNCQLSIVNSEAIFVIA